MLANDVEALPLACRVAAGGPVLFDAQSGPGPVRAHALVAAADAAAGGLAAGRYLPRVAAMTTVAPGIAERYERSTAPAAGW